MSSQRRLHFALLDFDSEEVQQYALSTLMPGVPMLFVVAWDINTNTVPQRVAIPLPLCSYSTGSDRTA